MNCKPGDLARAFRPGPYQNKLFFVIEAAPVGVEFDLPDGWTHVAVGPNNWILESAGGMFNARRGNGQRRTRFGVGGDAGLRPIRDQPGEDETLAWKEVPAPSAMTPKPQKEHT